jgi:hypothetical protein
MLRGFDFVVNNQTTTRMPASAKLSFTPGEWKGEIAGENCLGKIYIDRHGNTNIVGFNQDRPAISETG